MQFTVEFVSLLFKGLCLFLPIFLAFITVIYIMGQIAGRIEGWSRFDSFYWSFITALTVGYGDIRPLQKSSRIISIMIGLLGIILTGMIVSIAVFAATKAFEHNVIPKL